MQTYHKMCLGMVKYDLYDITIRKIKQALGFTESKATDNFLF